ncbi:MAG: hypothetical protein ACF8OB_10245 [Phycisphaeraceae bacterium JB051]
MKRLNNTLKCRVFAFSLIDMLVVLVLVVLLYILVLPCLGRTAPQMQNSTQIRGIHSALLLFSQGNNGYFPGMDAKGNLLQDSTVETRFMMLLNDNYFTSEYLISPRDTKIAWQKGAFTTKNYSFAMLNLSDSQSIRLDEWRDTQNEDAIVLSDRMLAKNKKGHIRSIWTRNDDHWRGSIGWNDNHVTFEATHDQFQTKYGKSHFKNDSLFDYEGASMVYAGDMPIYD